MNAALIADKRIKVTSTRDLSMAEVDQIADALDSVAWEDLAKQKIEEAGVDMTGIKITAEN